MDKHQVTTLELLDDRQYLKAYEQAFGPTYAVALNKYIPSYMHEVMTLYILTGVFPGSFLLAYLAGDLFTAIAYADDANRKLFHEYAAFLRNYAPSICFGDPESVKRWGTRGGLLGPETPEEQNIL